MTTFLLAAGFLALGIGALIAFDALRRPGDERDPEQPHNPRTRKHYEAETAAPLSQADVEAAAPLVAFVEEIGTGELPDLAFDIDPLAAPIPVGHRVAEPAFFHDVTADWLSAFAWPTSPAPAVPFTSVQVSEPDPYVAMSFTQDIWKAADLERMVAQEKAEASR